MTAMVATTLASPLAALSKRAPSLSVELSAVNRSTEVKAILTNTGAESVSLLIPGQVMDPRPVQKLSVYQNGLSNLSYSDTKA